MKASIIHVMERALNYVDMRLMHHGRRVAFLACRTLRNLGVQDETTLRDYALIALLHDIGAYKTEEINNMVRFESSTVWDHAVYGSLFIKYFSPVPQLAPAILFHHANCAQLSYLDPRFRHLAQSLKISDRADILLQTGALSGEALRKQLEAQRGIMFDPDVLDAFLQANPNGYRGGQSQESDEDFSRLLYGDGYADAEEAFIKMIVYAIDFRSPQTVTHTVTSTSVCEYLGSVVPLDPEEKKRLRRSAMLHDLGKIGTPPAILEKTGKLTDGEMAVMKQHVTHTKTILEGFSDEISLCISIRHHEKLDGSGYPYGLSAADLTTGQRLMAVADILSALATVRSYKDAFPKEKVVGILRSMADSGQLDPDIVDTAVREYDNILDTIAIRTGSVVADYHKMNAEYQELMGRVEHFSDGLGHGEMTA